MTYPPKLNLKTMTNQIFIYKAVCIYSEIEFLSFIKLRILRYFKGSNHMHSEQIKS